MKKLIVFMGPSGVGKTKLVQYLAEKHPGASIVTKQNIDINCHSNATQEYYNTLNKMLSKNNYVIADGHHVFKHDRDELFAAIDKTDLYIIGVWVENSWQNIVDNNNHKSKIEQLNEKDLEYLFKYRSSPTEDEIFNDIIYLMLNAGIGMSKTQPYLSDIYSTLDKI